MHSGSDAARRGTSRQGTAPPSLLFTLEFYTRTAATRRTVPFHGPWPCNCHAGSGV